MSILRILWALLLCLSSQALSSPVSQPSSEAKAPAVQAQEPASAVPSDNDAQVTVRRGDHHQQQQVSQRFGRHPSTSLGQQPQWAHCCLPQRRQWGVVLGNGQQQGSSTTLQWLHQDTVVARKLMAQQQRPPPMQQGHVLGAVAALPVLAVVLAMVAGRLRWFASSKQQDMPSTSCMADSSVTSEGGAMMVDASINVMSDDAACKATRSDSFGPEACEVAPTAQPRPLLAGHYGWVLSSSFTSPLVGHVGSQEIHFGPLLGAGSCSRVYKGKWRNRDVAVRVMPHDGLMLGQEQHMQRLTSLYHPNVVRTFLGVTYTRQGTTAAVHQHVGMLDSAQQLAKHDALKTSSSSRDQHTLQLSIRQQEQQQHQQFMVIAGSSPSTPMMGDMMSSTSSMPLSPMSISVAGPRASDSSTCALSPRAGLQQLRPARTSASSLAGDMEADAETWFVQEYCNGGSLTSMALQWQLAGEGDVQMFERLTLLVDVARGLKHLHSRDIIHGDLNADNVLVCKDGRSPVRVTAKVADMGLCCSIKQHMTRNAPRTVRAMSHVAPELQRCGRAGPESDVYSFGILMWEVFTGQPAYRKLLDAGHLYEAIVIQNLRPKIPQGMPADYQLLMERCWASDPADRPSLDKLIGCLSVMAAERNRRINPHADLPPPATPAAAAAVAAAAARGPWGSRLSPLVSSNSCDQATLQMLVQQQQGLGGADRCQQPLMRAGSLLAPRKSSLSRLAPGGLLHHKSCPPATFEALLRSGSLLARSSDASDASDDDKMDSADAVYAVLHEEEEMLLQMRAITRTQSGPGSAPVLHDSQPHQRYSDGLDMGPPGMDDAHTWHI